MTGARGFLIVAIVVILALSGLQYALRSNYKDRNYELFTEMVYSKAGESFTPSDVLPGRTTQQGLVPGVVPRGPLPLYYGTGEEEALRAGRELTNPFAADDAVALGRGRELFATYCTPCHGPGGDGDGVVVRRGMLPPPSLFAVRAVQMPEGQMFHVLTYGQGNMASYAAQLSRAERWQVILHVRNLQSGKQQ